MRINIALANDSVEPDIGKQFFLIRLNNNRPDYTDEDWYALIRYIKNHDGSNLSWNTTRHGEHDRSDTPEHSDGVSIGCASFKKTVSMTSLYELILNE